MMKWFKKLLNLGNEIYSIKTMTSKAGTQTVAILRNRRLNKNYQMSKNKNKSRQIEEETNMIKSMMQEK